MMIRFWVIVGPDGEEVATYGSANSDEAWIRFNDVDTPLYSTMIALATDAETIVCEYEITADGIYMLQAFGIAPVS